MKISLRILAFGLLALLCVEPARSQNTSKEAKPRPVIYDPKPFDNNIEHLPPNYVGNSYSDILTALAKQSKVETGRTSSQILTGSLTLESLLAFSFDEDGGQLTTKYLAEFTTLILTLKWDRNLAAGTHGGALFSLTWRENSDNFYVAASGDSLDSIKRPEAGEGDGSSELAQKARKDALDKTFSTSINMPPGDVPRAKANLRALVICRLAETPIHQDKGLKNSVVVIPVAIWFYDLPSGKVYAKLPHESPRPVTPTAGGVGVGSGSGNNEEFGPPVPRSAPKYEANKIYKPSEVSSKARIISRPKPVYTEEARNHKVSGTVVLRAIFRSDGGVTDIRTVSGLPYGLTERAVEAAKKIKFRPATVEGRPVSQYIQIEYNFILGLK